MTEERKNEIINITTELFVNEFDEMNLSRKMFNDILIHHNIEIYDYNEYCSLFKKTIDNLISSGGIAKIKSPKDLIHEMFKNAYVEKTIK